MTKDLSDPIAVRLPVDVLEDVERIAVAIDRTRSWVVVRALRLYLASEGEEVLSLLKAREEDREGDGHDADEVLHDLAAVVAGTKAA